MISRTLSNLHVSTLYGSGNSTIDATITRGHIGSITLHEQGAVRSAKHRIDCQGGFVTRSFCDSHIHLAGFCVARSQLHLDGMTLDEIHSYLLQIAHQRQAGTWIRGRGWEMNLWCDQMHRVSGFLDSVFPENPVSFVSKDGHSLWLNRIAMAETGLSSDQTDPPGGRYDRDPQTGLLTGMLRETAAEEVLRRLPKPTETEIEALLPDGIRILIENGITSVHAFENETNIHRLIRYLRRSSQKLKCRFYVESHDFDSVFRFFHTERDLPDTFCFGGLKLFADGALGSRTAAVTCPYNHDSSNFGLLVMDRHQITEAGLRAAEYGTDVSVHAIGDRALGETLEAFKLIRSRFPRTVLRVEHIQLARKNDIDCMKELGVIASIQPSHLLSDRAMAAEIWSLQTGLLYPYGSLENAAIPILFGSDAPIEPPDPFRSLRAAMFRLDWPDDPDIPVWHPDEIMSIPAAAHSACATNIRRILSTDTGWGEGCRADLAVWDRDPMDYIRSGGPRPQALLVMAGGSIVLDRLTS